MMINEHRPGLPAHSTKLSFKNQLLYLGKTQRVACSLGLREDHKNENKCPDPSNSSATSQAQAFYNGQFMPPLSFCVIVNNWTMLAVAQTHF